ncbi:hypothetical protein IE81DRAFT_364747 [Ceraceosorus guamensis]|uniref:Copper acquisition factor BIM1-like domain-containing protein n=1 Tax=Ceraceosorus guamensis TaxID=1522189 RepID=A0A316W9U0_9BASI|nr:hypothetical protein IE81DRAFT_364747 [Ceraceosorus guamensis]PWN44763.1 hypothetical protein IE81DRAFT_364747 [Ceraceosorus guamensis]
MSQRPTGSTMGPAAFMWPADRPWAAEYDNVPPCGSSAGVGERTPFPLTDGRLAMITQNETTAVHMSISYDNNPTSLSQFETFYTPNEVDLDLGHTCVWAPDPPANVTAGTNATFSLMYVANAVNEAPAQVFYACTDVTFVEPAAFAATGIAVPCFNATREAPAGDTVTTESGTTLTNPHVDSSAQGSGGLTGGQIAGAVVGSVAGAALLLGLAFALFKRRHAKAEARASTDPFNAGSRMEQSSDGSNSLASRSLSEMKQAH